MNRYKLEALLMIALPLVVLLLGVLAAIFLV